ncbi:MAG TPA: hypothetical protein VGM51_08345 [Armatimonadota bacterium]|jgi:hypothetical protein
MKRSNLFLFAFLAGAAAQAQQTPASLSLSPDGMDHITVYTDRVESTPDGNALVFSGQSQPVRAEIYRGLPDGKLPPAIVLTAETVTVDYNAGEVVATNSVTLLWDNHVATGSSARYNWTKREGRIETVRFSEDGMEFRAASLEMLPNRRLMLDATFSGCGLDNPDYVIHAQSVTLNNDRRISARHVSLDLFHHRIVTLPLFTHKARPKGGSGRQALPFPRPGRSQVSGFTLSQAIALSDNVNVEVEVTTRVGWRGIASYANEGRITPYAVADWKQERASRDRLPVLVSRVPELGIRFGDNSANTLNVGSYREHSTGVSARRATASYEHTVLDHGEHPGLRLIVGARASAYSTHDFYRTARADVSIGREGKDRDTFEEVGMRLNGLQGHTPFQWDQVLVQTEAYAGKRISWGHYRLETDLRYDVGNHKMYDVEVGIAKRLRCVEPEIRYSDRRRAVFFDVRVLN